MQNKNKVYQKINSIDYEKIKNINMNKYEQHYNSNNDILKNNFYNKENNKMEIYFIKDKNDNIKSKYIKKENNEIEDYFIKNENNNLKSDYIKKENNEIENYIIKNKSDNVKNNYMNNEIRMRDENFYNGEKCKREKKLQNKIKIISINKQIHLISESKIVNEIEIIKKIKNEKDNYDVILIDIENEMRNYFSMLLEEIDKIIFLTEANVLQIKKSKIYLEEMIKNYKLEKEKINIVCNKIKENTLSINILKNVLKDYNILGKINDVKDSNLLINHNMKNIFLEKEIKRQYQKIGNEILKNKNTPNYYINKIE